MAPEIIEHKPYDGFKADIFSLGVILFISVLGKFPFPRAELSDKYYKLLQNPDLHNKFWEVQNGQNTSEEFKELFISMTKYNPSKRPALKDIIKHPWLKSKFSDEKIR